MAEIVQWTGGFYGKLVYDESDSNPETNKSKVNATLKLGSAAGYSFYGYETKGTITIDGTDYGVSTWTNLGKGSEITIGSASKTITHDANGNKSINIKFNVWNNYFGSASKSTTFGLGKINRCADTTAFNISKTDGQYDFENSMSVNFDKHSASGYNYKLRISIPNVEPLQTTTYNTSGTSFYLNETSINRIYEYAEQNNLTTINLGARVETYNGSSKVSDGNEKIVTCPILPKGRIYINGAWKRAQVYYGTNGSWKRATPYIGSNGSWKRSK